MSFDFYSLFIAIIPVLFAITMHEYAHGWAAKRYGDNTAYMEGRLTLNPINHIDLVGTIIFPLISFVLGGFMFGWAKPVPVNFSRLKNFKSDAIKVSLAGPVSNLLMAIGWALILCLSILITHYTKLPLGEGLLDMAKYGIIVNCIFLTFNLLPFLPLDGGKILQFLLPYKYAKPLDFLEQYGMIIIILLAFTGILGMLINPIVHTLSHLLTLPALQTIVLLR